MAIYSRLKQLFIWMAIIATVLVSACKAQRGAGLRQAMLDRQVSMPVFRAERLESVMMRLAMNTGRKFNIQALIVSNAMAKAADYKDAPMRTILEEQLNGTPFFYRLTKSELKIFKK